MPNVTQRQIQHGAFVSQDVRLGMDRSAFEPLRFLGMSQDLGRDVPDRLTPLPFGDTGAVQPGPTGKELLLDALQQKYGYVPRPSYDVNAYLSSPHTPGVDPSDVDPVSGLPRMHDPSLFKTMASPTRFLPTSLVQSQMPMPKGAPSVFDTKTAMLKRFAVAPSSGMVDMYHEHDQPAPRSLAGRGEIVKALLEARSP